MDRTELPDLPRTWAAFQIGRLSDRMVAYTRNLLVTPLGDGITSWHRVVIWTDGIYPNPDPRCKDAVDMDDTILQIQMSLISLLDSQDVNVFYFPELRRAFDELLHVAERIRYERFQLCAITNDAALMEILLDLHIHIEHLVHRILLEDRWLKTWLEAGAYFGSCETGHDLTKATFLALLSEFGNCINELHDQSSEEVFAECTRMVDRLRELIRRSPKSRWVDTDPEYNSAPWTTIATAPDDIRTALLAITDVLFQFCNSTEAGGYDLEVDYDNQLFRLYGQDVPFSKFQGRQLEIYLRLIESAPRILTHGELSGEGSDHMQTIVSVVSRIRGLVRDHLKNGLSDKLATIRSHPGKFGGGYSLTIPRSRIRTTGQS